MTEETVLLKARKYYNEGEYQESFDFYKRVDSKELTEDDINKRGIIEKLLNLPKQKLNSQQINYLLDFIKPLKGIPEEAARFKMEQKKNKLIEQLKKISVYPALLPKLKKKIIDKYYKSIVQPGTMVGIIAGQSIGEKQTQSTLNTFHSAGSSHQTVTKGVPRVDEIISCSRVPKQEVSYIHIKEEEKISNINDVLKLINPHLVYVLFEDLYSTAYSIKKISDEKDIPKWYKYYHYINENNELSTLRLNTLIGKYYVRFKLTKEFMVSNFITMDLIVLKLNQYRDKLFYIVPSPSDINAIDIFFIEGEDNYNDTRSVMSNISSFIQNDINKIHISGIKNITYAFPMHDNHRIIQTIGSNLEEVFRLPFIDSNQTYSNNIWEIYEILGIEAAYSYITKELADIMNGLCFAHIKLLTSKITYAGILKPCNRYTKRSEKGSGPIGKSTFEEPGKIFKEAALFTMTDPLSGVSSSILAAKESPAGTGLFDITMTQ
jgi:DNA-directed RNA polymerase beta' subunit